MIKYKLIKLPVGEYSCNGCTFYNIKRTGYSDCEGKPGFVDQCVKTKCVKTIRNKRKYYIWKAIESNLSENIKIL